MPGDKAAWADYNNDGYVDLNLGSKLLRNNGNGTFSSLAASHGTPIWGDYNNDGFVDLFDYSSGRLWRNNQGNSFSILTLAGMPPSSRGATWGDFSGDGYLDLYVGGYESYPDAYYADVIYTNNRNGTFTKTWTQGLDALTTPGRPRPARGVTSADWDQDGDIDVYVSNYRLEPNALWQNNGSGTFTDVAGAKNALATSPGYYGGHSIGSTWGDFNNDGLIDLFAGNFAHAGQPQSQFLKNLGPSAGYAFQNMGTGGVFYQESYASPTAGDIDNDGDLDLYFTTVYPTASFGVPNYPILFRNDGNFNFVDVTTAWGLPKSGEISTYQAAFADYDNDGFLDLMTDGKLYRNTGGTNHYLKVRFDGDPLRDATAIGAQVRINVNGQTLTRQVEGAVGEGNQNDHTLHFGLGSYTGPLTLQVVWPDGAARTLNVLGVDRTITVSISDPVGVGTLTVQGNFSQGAGGTLSIEIAGLAAGTQYDQLVVTGNATLDGTLAVTLLNGFVPSLGDAFNVLTYGSHSGTFSNLMGMALGDHLALRPTYGSTSLRLTARPAQDGDINLDGIVNIFDINAVSSHWSETGPQGDANGDGTVNIFDINLISANWTPSGGAAAVPEPGALLLMGFGASLSFVRFRNYGVIDARMNER